MAVVAKFRVTEVVNRESYVEGKVNATIDLMAEHPSDDDDQVTRDENEKFWDATPQGKISMTIQNPLAAEQLQPGNRFYVTFERADG
jgi:hypothetical protein